MSDFSRTYQPWEKDFSEGLYLAGAECMLEAEAPAGWTKWTIPGFVYISVEKEDGSTFGKALDYLKENGMTLAGAVQEFNCPVTGREYLYFPVNRL